MYNAFKSVNRMHIPLLFSYSFVKCEDPILIIMNINLGKKKKFAFMSTYLVPQLLVTIRNPSLCVCVCVCVCVFVCVHEEIKGRLNSGNVCYHSLHNLLSSSFLPRNIKIRTYKTISLPVVFLGVKLGRSR